MAHDEQALQEFLDGERSYRKGAQNQTCTDSRLIGYEVQRLVDGEHFRMDNQSFIKTADGNWHNLQIQIQRATDIPNLRNTKRKATTGRKVGGSGNNSTATVATLLVEDQCTASAARIRAVWRHVCFPYQKGTTYNRGKLYRDGRVTKFDDKGRNQEVKWEGREGLDGTEIDDAPGPSTPQSRRKLGAKRNRGDEYYLTHLRGLDE